MQKKFTGLLFILFLSLYSLHLAAFDSQPLLVLSEDSSEMEMVEFDIEGLITLLGRVKGSDADEDDVPDEVIEDTEDGPGRDGGDCNSPIRWDLSSD